MTSVSFTGPVFIVGMPRSGTTLLSMMLTAHPDVAIAPETHFFSYYWRHTHRPPAERLRRFLEGGVLEEMGHPEDARHRIEQIANASLTPEAVLGAVLRTYAERQGTRVWGEKTPAHLEYADVIWRHFPEARLLALVRDPRDVTRSLQRVPWDHENVIHHARRWRTYAAHIARYEQERPDRFTAVRYEDLLRQPEDVLRRVCRFVGVSFETAMLAYHEADDRTFNPAQEPWKRNALRPPDPSRIGQWRQALPPGDVWLVERIAGPAMQQHGYPLARPRFTPRVAAQVAGRSVEYVARRVINKVRHRWQARYSPEP
jgi:LPS sulfotransferase NodH